MIRHVCESVRTARRIDRVLVATDDDRIALAVRGFGVEAVMTSPRHPSGTDRVAEAAASIDADLVVNVQGDEPMMAGAWVDAALEPLLQEPGLALSTLSLPLLDPEEMLSPSVVKVVSDLRGDALYFSRSPLPHFRLGAGKDFAGSAREAVARGLCRKHVGLYAYRRDALLRLASLPPSPLEEAEGLEQLRALQDGMRIRVVPVQGEATVAVDTPQDLERVRELMAPDAART
jgi:3-deoxy-manno-octulosonate cytidylyltransferase (CMP-KDO synthetase)